MKKIILSLLIITLLASLVACTSTSNPSTNNPPVNNPSPTSPTSPTQPAPKKIVLTPENISEYFIISCTVSNVTIEKDPYLNEGHGVLTVKFTPKKRGDFENVSLSIRLDTSGDDWIDGFVRSVEIPFDGKLEYVENIVALSEGFIYTTPVFKATVTSATGYFVG